ncbi:hypothetical protein NHQ30_008954 [Ciborinia camelliae]|nr:hypothetical protein NHQ30_008954 [Ciborinia camelliae]
MAPDQNSLTVQYAKGDKVVPLNTVLFSGHKPTDSYSYMSTFYPVPFKDTLGISYSTAESYFQAGKAWLIGDDDKFMEIAHAKDGFVAKKMGNNIKGLDVARWNEISRTVMKRALYHKFRNNQAIRDDLLSTGNKLIVAAQDDKVWGSGLRAAKTIETPISQWPGDNKLGEELMALRSFFRDSEVEDDTTTRTLIKKESNGDSDEHNLAPKRHEAPQTVTATSKANKGKKRKAEELGEGVADEAPKKK